MRCEEGGREGEGKFGVPSHTQCDAMRGEAQRRRKRRRRRQSSLDRSLANIINSINQSEEQFGLIIVSPSLVGELKLQGGQAGRQATKEEKEEGEEEAGCLAAGIHPLFLSLPPL